MLKWGDYPGLSRLAQCNKRWKREQEERVGEGDVKMEVAVRAMWCEHMTTVSGLDDG